MKHWFSKQWLSAFALSLALGASPALAADLGGGPPAAYPGSLQDDAPYVRPFSWSGTYAGLQLGYGWAETDARSGPVAAFDQSYSYDSDGFLGGGHIGFNFQNQGIVYGLEADIDFADLSSSSIGSLGAIHTTGIDWMGSLRARAGLAAGRNLFYVTGGWAFGDVSIRSETGAVAYSDTRHGWTLGAGLERAVSDTMTARLEYRYTDFGSLSGQAGALADESDVTLHAIRAGVSIRF